MGIIFALRELGLEKLAGIAHFSLELFRYRGRILGILIERCKQARDLLLYLIYAGQYFLLPFIAGIRILTA